MSEPPRETPHDRPNRLPLPPLVFFAALVAAYGLEGLWPLPVPLPREPVRIKGAVMVGLGLMLIVWAAATFARARTTILPHRASSALVTGGPYALSRNPIYLGDALILSGFGGAADSLWYDLAAVLALIVTDRLAVRSEEAHLAARFGPAWEAYAGRVRRWL